MTASTRSVPVTMGSPSFRSLELDGFGVTEAWFPATDVLPRHTHDRACVAIMLDGSFDLRLTGRVYQCFPTSVFIEPAGEGHANFIGPAGAHVVVVQPDPASTDLLQPFTGLLDRAAQTHHAGLAARATRLARELDCPDDLSALAAEGMVLEMLVDLARLDQRDLRTRAILPASSNVTPVRHPRPIAARRGAEAIKESG